MGGDDGDLSILNRLVLRSAAAEPERLEVVIRGGRIAALLGPGSSPPHGRVVVKNRRLIAVDYDALVEDAADLAAALRRDHRDHFDRMAPAAAFIADTARRRAARPLPYARWAAAGDGASALSAPRAAEPEPAGA